ncbi:hypothetical protein [Streptomyces sp. NBC_00338]|uniref:hypothetical protein n=1 Tax=Streptomyces sp. NBC_00338 TaxID=2975715 RepID=UPI002253EDB3|nr:hypothetical protein [Streptomyces sp. NBC_00338]MCX5144638.1 hypothetical protein [Streptomyces sp. NBC_00338]MCX5145066.1 hypothetical protein [Streptomyces sp. NBC_00338]
MAELMGIDIAQGGAVALLTLVVLMVLTGRLVPRRTYDDLLEERNTWRSAHTTSEEARRLEREQVGELLELSRTADRVLTALPHPVHGEVKAHDEMDVAQPPT